MEMGYVMEFLEIPRKLGDQENKGGGGGAVFAYL